MKLRLIVLILIPFASWTQGSKGFDFHVSVNHPVSSISRIRTFYGGGIGANILFRDTNVVSFKTGIELNYFHTWDDQLTSNENNVHYQYAVLSIPGFVRLTFGNKFKVFVEGGAYIGFPAGGRVRSLYTVYYSNSPDVPSIKETRYAPYFSGVSITPAVSLGARFPISKYADLVLKPEFAFMENRIGVRNDFDDDDFDDDQAFSKRFFYARFCAGIHLKPKTKK